MGRLRSQFRCRAAIDYDHGSPLFVLGVWVPLFSSVFISLLFTLCAHSVSLLKRLLGFSAAKESIFRRSLLLLSCRWKNHSPNSFGKRMLLCLYDTQRPQKLTITTSNLFAKRNRPLLSEKSRIPRLDRSPHSKLIYIEMKASSSKHFLFV